MHKTFFLRATAQTALVRHPLLLVSSSPSLLGPGANRATVPKHQRVANQFGVRSAVIIFWATPLAVSLASQMYVWKLSLAHLPHRFTRAVS